jgi:hypothetical protein
LPGCETKTAKHPITSCRPRENPSAEGFVERESFAMGDE